ncbi:MAG: hypothetical protein V4596_14505 [Bdellovibrionota bacterium]
MIQLNPSIPLETPKGSGQAMFLIDYGTEHDLYWVVFIDDTRECWTFSNRDVRAQPNITMGRMPAPSPLHKDEQKIHRI